MAVVTLLKQSSPRYELRDKASDVRRGARILWQYRGERYNDERTFRISPIGLAWATVSPVAAVVVRRAETLPVCSEKHPSHASCRFCDAVITYASPTYRPPLKAWVPIPPSVKVRRMCALTPVFNPLFKVDRRPSARSVGKTPSSFSPVFPLVFKTSRVRWIPFRARIERGLSAKQMPLSGPRETEETVYLQRCIPCHRSDFKVKVTHSCKPSVAVN